VDADRPPEQVEDALDTLETGVNQQTLQVAGSLDGLGDSIQQKSVTRVKEQLGELETAVEKIPSPDPPPKTTLQLQNQADVEGAWQNYLQYFLNPDANHGLGIDALLQFLRGLDDVSSEDFPTRLSDDVVVEAEVSSPNNNIPDIVIQEPGEFFVCCELKLYSSEGQNQTTRYVNDNYIGSTQKNQFPEHRRYYVYIRRPGRPRADADEFLNVTWLQLQEWLKPLSFSNQGRYPSRTTAQLADFLDTIQQDMSQDEHIQTAQEKMELYFNHEDAIREAREGLNTVYEHEEENWRRRFVEGYLPDNWTENWHTNPSKYGQIYHSKWRQDDGLSISDAEIKMHFVHLIRNKDSFTDGKLTFQLRMPSGGPYRDRLEELFMSERFADDLDSVLGRYDIDKGPGMNYGNPRLTGKTYSVVKSALPESYYETLQQATREHIEVVPVINEILDTAIEEVEEDMASAGTRQNE
jgi:hypothetical protein